LILKDFSDEPKISSLKELFEIETMKEITISREKKLRKFVSIGAFDIVTPVYKLEQFVDAEVTNYSNTRIISSDYPFVPFIQSGLTNSNGGRRLVHAIYTTIIRLRAATRLKKLKAQGKRMFHNSYQRKNKFSKQVR
jgi:hypothetical protein